MCIGSSISKKKALLVQTLPATHRLADFLDNSMSCIGSGYTVC